MLNEDCNNFNQFGVMNSLFFFFSLLIILVNNSYSQNNCYHAYRTTASVPQITQWNIQKDSDIEYKIHESIDNEGRVASISFYKNESVYDVTPYSVPIIRYIYKKDSIFEYYYDSEENPLNLINEEFPEYRLYIISNDSILVKSYACYGGKLNPQNTKFILFYLYSYQKYFGYFIKSKEYKFDRSTLELYYSEELVNELYSN